MKRVYKYPLGYNDVIQLTLPIGAELLHLDMQDDVPTLWALVDPDQTEERTRVLRFAGTGHDIQIEPGGEIVTHIGSAIDRNTGLVWHLFEIEERGY